MLFTTLANHILACNKGAADLLDAARSAIVEETGKGDAAGWEVDARNAALRMITDVYEAMVATKKNPRDITKAGSSMGGPFKVAANLLANEQFFKAAQTAAAAAAAAAEAGAKTTPKKEAAAAAAAAAGAGNGAGNGAAAKGPEAADAAPAAAAAADKEAGMGRGGKRKRLTADAVDDGQGPPKKNRDPDDETPAPLGLADWLVQSTIGSRQTTFYDLPSDVTSQVPSVEAVAEVYTDLIRNGSVHKSATSKSNDPLTQEQLKRRVLKLFNDLAKEWYSKSGWTLKKWYSKWSPLKSSDTWPSDDDQCETLADMLADLVMANWEKSLGDAASADAPSPAPAPVPEATSPKKEELYDCQCTRAVQPTWIAKKCSGAGCDKECQVCWEHALALWEGLCQGCREM